MLPIPVVTASSVAVHLVRRGLLTLLEDCFRDAGRPGDAVVHDGVPGVQVRIREAELQEPLVRLKQAERRLARLQPRPPEKAAGGREQQEKRLQELENKVNQLIEEMRSLQRELRRQKPADPPPPVKVPS